MNHIYSITLIISFFLLSTNAFSQNNREADNSNVSIYDIDKDGFTIDLRINNINITKTKLNESNYLRLQIDDFGKSLDIGNPELPVYKRLIELPEGANYRIEIISKSTEKIDLYNAQHFDFIKPAQASILKVENPDNKFEINETTYKTDANYSLDLVSIIPLGKMRSTSLARIEISPIKYNPVSNTIEYVNKLVVRVHISDYDAEKLISDKKRFYSPNFEVHNNAIINSKAYTLQSKSATIQYPHKYVIVADSMFKQSLQPFVRWKEKKGYKVIEAYMQDAAVGTTTTSIKSYLQGLYYSATATDPAPTYVLFVGDVAQLPAWNSTTGGSHVSDLHYCEYTGDFFPEMMYGRFSANDTSELNPQIQKTIEYETYTMPDPSFLGKTVLISGYDGSGHAPTYGDGQINYGTAEYFNSTNSTNCSSYLFVNGSFNQDAEIFQQIDSGVSIANYTAHGAIQGWADPTFYVNDVANMTNKGKYPLMIGNACITNHFNSPVCFGEGLMRAKNKGAIGYIGASDNTYWDEDYYWAVGYGAITSNPTYASLGPGLYDRMFHTHGEVFTDWAMSSFQYILAGNLAVTQGGSYLNYYFEIYHVMGDPSLMAYQRVPSQITASYIPFISSGTATYQVNTIPHALIALSQNDTLISSSMSDANGIAVLNLGANFNKIGVIYMVITAQNYAPYINTIFGGNPTGPYVISSNIIIDDTLSNNNGMADYGETIMLDVDFSNLTTFTSNGTISDIQTNDTQVVIINNSTTIGNISGMDTIHKNNAFTIQIDSNAIDQHQVLFDIVIQDVNNTVWTTPIVIPIYAPNIVIGEIQIKDTLNGSSNGVIEAGESVIVKIKLINTGSRDAKDVVCNYTSNYNKVTVSNEVTINTLQANSYVWVSYKVDFDANVFNGRVTNLVFDYVSHAYSGTQAFPLVVGEFDENFERGNFSKFMWDTTSTDGWLIDTTYVYEGMYSMRSKLSAQDNDISTISLNMNVLTDDTISFYTKISTESGYDKLNFMIDGTLMDKWSGNYDWKRKSFAVAAGNHTFTWEYAKDYYMSDNLDAVWIDYIKFPPTDAWNSINNNEEEIISDISVWPNPATDNVNLKLYTNIKTDILITVYNQLGQLVINNPEINKSIIGDYSTQINTSELKSGTYLIKISTDEQQYYQKLIIK